MQETSNLERIHRYAYYLLGLGSGFLIGGLTNYSSTEGKRELLVPVAGAVIMIVAGAIASLTKRKSEPKS